jgi:nucleoside-triphosphatase
MHGLNIKPVYLLTGRPGTGKTSLIKQVLPGSHIKAGGFFTEEIRVEGTRVGFKLVTLEGHQAVLSHVDFNKRFRVGKYGVDITALEKVGIPALLEAAKGDSLVVVDEIGKMELLSPAFRDVIASLIDSSKKMLGTIMLQPDPRADTIKHHPNVILVSLSRDNYSQVLADVLSWLKTPLNPAP